MAPLAGKYDLLQQLQQEVLSLQGFKRSFADQRISMGLGAIEQYFPGRIFPTGAIHEFISRRPEEAAATSGFMAGLLSKLMHQNGKCLWISQGRAVFPPALTIFGIEPDRIIFIDLNRQKDLLWTIEEALKCESLAAVVGETGELGFTESRRLQLATEQSHVTGFIHRFRPRKENPVASVARWKIQPLISATGDLPGVGAPMWRVELCRARNGRPGSWDILWVHGGFRYVSEHAYPLSIVHQERKAG